MTAYTFLFACLGTLPMCGVGSMVEKLAAQPVGILWYLGISVLCTVAPLPALHLGPEPHEQWPGGHLGHH